MVPTSSAPHGETSSCANSTKSKATAFAAGTGQLKNRRCPQRCRARQGERSLKHRKDAPHHARHTHAYNTGPKILFRILSPTPACAWARKHKATKHNKSMRAMATSSVGRTTKDLQGLLRALNNEASLAHEMRMAMRSDYKDKPRCQARTHAQKCQLTRNTLPSQPTAKRLKNMLRHGHPERGRSFAPNPPAITAHTMHPSSLTWQAQSKAQARELPRRVSRRAAAARPAPQPSQKRRKRPRNADRSHQAAPHMADHCNFSSRAYAAKSMAGLQIPS